MLQNSNLYRQMAESQWVRRVKIKKKRELIYLDVLVPTDTTTSTRKKTIKFICLKCQNFQKVSQIPKTAKLQNLQTKSCISPIQKILF